MTPSFIEELSGQFKKFKTYLDAPTEQNQDTDVKNLNEQIQKTSEMLEKAKHKLVEPFNIKLPDYRDKNLEELIFYQQKIKEIKERLDNLKVTDESLKILVSDFYNEINFHIKKHCEKGQPKTKDRPLNR
ncbi:hypothetical protein FACHB389_04655 [Nostoc calcicola FACHB-389]|nr:hypothetical protein [Nostoc calcicola FACHB-3891]OKH41452.1 hypothetical protein FACHB389_04655 [Nostoc calcicola FACHB-389]